MNYLHYLSGLVESVSLLGGVPCFCNFSRATKQLQFTYSLRGCNICQDVDYHANLGLCLPSQIQSQSSNYTYRFPQCSPKLHEELCDHNSYHPQSNGILSPMIEPDPSPPSALIHPTLLEKLRLGAPTSGHIQLSTLNKSQSQHAVVDEFYRLQDSSPFPKLPPYFIHSTTDKLSVREPNERDDIHNSSSCVNGTIHRSRPELTRKQKCEYMPTSVTAYCLHTFTHTHRGFGSWIVTLYECNVCL